MIKVSAPCKVHFLGEWAVVWNKPAILATVGKRMFVTIAPRVDKNITIKSEGIDQTLTITESEVLKQIAKAQILWKKYATDNDIVSLKEITKNPLDYIVIAIGETLKFYAEKLEKGFDLEVKSEVPVGSGLGSSAAIAVSVVGALTLHLGKEFNREIINQIAYIIEHKKNGLPSGGDNSAICFGGLIWFRKETPDFKIIQSLPFTLSKKLSKNFVLINTGKPEESTGELIGMVRELYKRQPQVINKFLESQEKLVRELLKVVKDANEGELIKLIKEGEKNLETLGVCSPDVKKIIRQIEKVGGAGKICGAGGKTKATGIVLAYHKDRKILEKIATDNNLNYFSVELGVEGLKIEN